MRVDIYWNLHKKIWSIRHNGIVIEHLDNVFVEDVSFVVQPAGRRKVRKTRRKNVHAFVRGEIADKFEINNLQRVRYNPYQHTSFVDAETSKPIHSASQVFLSEEGKCFMNIGGDNESITSCQTEKGSIL
jgi:hypothetical protein